MNRNVVVIILLISCFVANAQNYKTAIGIRFGSEIGLTIQQIVGKHQTLEGIISTGIRNKDAKVALLWEDHYPMLGKRFNLYYGVGVNFNLPNTQNTSFVRQPGATGLVGAELSFGRYVFSIDTRPIVNFRAGSSQCIFENMAAFSVKYILVEREDAIDRLKRKIRAL